MLHNAGDDFVVVDQKKKQKKLMILELKIMKQIH